MKHHLLRFWQMVQPGIVNNKQCDEERWALVGKSKKVYSFAVISRPSVCNLYSGTNTQLRLPLSHALITAHISISWYLVIFSKTLSPEIFSSFIFLCQGQLNDNRDPAGVVLVCLSPSYIVALFQIEEASLQSQELLLTVEDEGQVEC